MLLSFYWQTRSGGDAFQYVLLGNAISYKFTISLMVKVIVCVVCMFMTVKVTVCCVAITFVLYALFFVQRFNVIALSSASSSSSLH